MITSFLKKSKFLCLLMFALIFLGCKKEEVEPEPEVDPVPEFAMTLKINGTLHEFNNTFGSNEASTTTIFTYYPKEEYILLQGKKGFAGDISIQMWINRDDLVVGTYQVGFDTDGEDTHVDLIDNSNNILENTASGSISISEIDTVLKRVKGTFAFTSTDGDSDSDPIDYTITDGTFDYFYDVE